MALPAPVDLMRAANRRPGLQDDGDGRDGMALGQVLAILAAYYRLSIIIFVLVVAATAEITHLMPRAYTSKATLIINRQTNDPLVGGRDMPGDYMSTFMQTEIELMQGPDILDEVISRLNLSQIPEFAGGNQGGSATLRDWVEAGLRKKLDIEQARSGSQLVTISAWATNAKLAADIANTVVDVYLERQVMRNHGPAGERAARYDSELADLKRKVEVAQAAVTSFRAKNGAVGADNTKADVEVDLLDALEHKLLDARAALVTNQAKASGRQQDATPNAMESGSVSTLRAEEAKLRSRMAQLRTTFGPNHPQVLELQSEIDANQASLTAALATYRNAASNAASSSVSISDSEVRSLERAVAAQRSKVAVNRRARDEAAKYELELDSAQQVYRKALAGYDQAKFSNDSESSLVSVSSRARPSPKADRPNVMNNILLGFAMGFGLALAVPFVLELPRRRIRCREDIERGMGMPVLSEFSELKRLEFHGKRAGWFTRRKGARNRGAEAGTSDRSDDSPGADQPRHGDQGDLIVPEIQGARKTMHSTTSLICRPGFELVAANLPTHPHAERIRHVRTEVMLRHPAGRTECLAFAVISPAHGEGRSVLAAELAVSFARLGRSTLLVDADLRRPRQHALFQSDVDNGLRQAITQFDTNQVRGVYGYPSLSLMTAGHPTEENPSELLSDGRFDELMSRLRETFDYIVVDTPPFLEYTDGQVIATVVGHVLVVETAGESRMKQAKAMLNHLAPVGAQVLGAILNRV